MSSNASVALGYSLGRLSARTADSSISLLAVDQQIVRTIGTAVSKDGRILSRLIGLAGLSLKRGL